MAKRADTNKALADLLHRYAALREAETGHGWGPAYLSRITGIPKETIQNWFSGRVHEPNPYSLGRLAAALGIPREELAAVVKAEIPYPADLSPKGIAVREQKEAYISSSGAVEEFLMEFRDRLAEDTAKRMREMIASDLAELRQLITITIGQNDRQLALLERVSMLLQDIGDLLRRERGA
jgi:transcriptional regulator with XRE-family HTH domain